MKKVAEIHPSVVMVRDEGADFGSDYQRVMIGWTRTMMQATTELKAMGWEISEALPDPMPIDGPLVIEVQKIQVSTQAD